VIENQTAVKNQQRKLKGNTENREEIDGPLKNTWKQKEQGTSKIPLRFIKQKTLRLE